MPDPSVCRTGRGQWKIAPHDDHDDDGDDDDDDDGDNGDDHNNDDDNDPIAGVCRTGRGQWKIAPHGICGTISAEKKKVKMFLFPHLPIFPPHHNHQNNQRIKALKPISRASDSHPFLGFVEVLNRFVTYQDKRNVSSLPLHLYET